MTTMTVTPAEFEAAGGTGDWRVLYGGAHAFFAADSYAQAAALVAAVADLAAGQEPDVDLRREGVAVKLITRAARDLTTHDVELARRISAAAAGLGLQPQPEWLTMVQLAIASVPTVEVDDFWIASLGYVRQSATHLVDPLRRNPSVFLQGELDESRPRRGRMHVDVCVPSDQLQARVAATVATGGRRAAVPDDADWVTLADAENHGIDIVSIIGRESTRLQEAAPEG